jgi:tetratricopeptide (TPR) repeat protein
MKKGRRSMRAMLAAAAVMTAGLLVGPAIAAPSGGGGGGMSSAPAGRQIDPQRAYQEGVAALQARDYRTAVARLRDVLSVAPRDPMTNYVYALALIGNGEPRQARRPLERAVRGDNPPPDAFHQLGLIHLQANDREEAIAQQTALANMLAACAAACGDQRRAQIQAAHDALTNALNAGTAPAQNPGMSWFIPDTPEGRAAYARAVGLINSQHYAEALVALDRAHAAIGPHPDILNYRGFASRKLGRYDAALAYYREALALDPNHLGANEYLGELYLEMRRAEDARRQLARLDDLCPYGCAEREELSRWIHLASR